MHGIVGIIIIMKNSLSRIIALLIVILLLSSPFSSFAQQIIFQRNLTVGSRDMVDTKDVSALQSILIKEGYLSISNPSGYFGNLTKLALIKWQKTNQLPATGFFGPMSRSILNAIKVVKSPATFVPLAEKSKEVINPVVSPVIPSPVVKFLNNPTNSPNGGKGDVGFVKKSFIKSSVSASWVNKLVGLLTNQVSAQQNDKARVLIYTSGPAVPTMNIVTDLYLYNFETKQKELLLANEKYNVSPRIVGDGSGIAYIEGFAKNNTLKLLNLADKSQVYIEKHAMKGYYAVSPDGSQIAYVTPGKSYGSVGFLWNTAQAQSVPSASIFVFVYNVTTGVKQQIEVNNFESFQDIAWSKDGNKVLVIARQYERVKDVYDAIVQWDILTNEAKTIFSSSSAKKQLAIVPDAENISFVNEEPNDQVLHIVDTRGNIINKKSLGKNYILSYLWINESSLYVNYNGKIYLIDWGAGVERVILDGYTLIDFGKDRNELMVFGGVPKLAIYTFNTITSVLEWLGEIRSAGLGVG